MIIKDKDGTNVTNAVTTGAPTVGADDYITLPAIHSLVKSANPYRLEVWFTVNGNRLGPWAELWAV